MQPRCMHSPMSFLSEIKFHVHVFLGTYETAAIHDSSRLNFPKPGSDKAAGFGAQKPGE